MNKEGFQLSQLGCVSATKGLMEEGGGGGQDLLEQARNIRGKVE